MNCAPWRRGDIGYCSNVHPGERLHEVLGIVRSELAAIREARGLGRMAAGLWLSAVAVREVLAGDVSRLAAVLDEAGIDLVSCNGFPHGGFHGDSVKDGVYSPDWSDERRLRYSRDLATMLAAVMPAHSAVGTISTVPLGGGRDRGAAWREMALRNLCRMVGVLHRLENDRGRHIRLCLEMEPGCVLERTDEAVVFFSHELPRAGRRWGLSEDSIQRYLGVCYDICHQAVMFEDAARSLAALAKAGVTVGKIQISNALHVASPARCRASLSRYAHSPYLHQVYSRGEPSVYPDLIDVLDDADALANHPWRIHFHVPVHRADFSKAGLATTQDEIHAVFDYLAVHSGCRPHLEVETYTWPVCPDMAAVSALAMREGIVDELAWVEGELQKRGLLGSAAPEKSPIKARGEQLGDSK